jgi:hypothetical protein
MDTTGTRTFHIGDILSVTTERLVSPRFLDGIYDILGWMTGEDLATQQLPRACIESAPSLREQFPDLAGAIVPEDFGGSKEAVAAWLAEQVALFGETREVTPLAPGDHARIDMLTELRMVAPDAEIIVVEVGDHA